MKMPFVIGVTGHRDLRPQDIPLLRKTVRSELQKLKNAYPASDYILLDSVASGADMLCAQEALKLGFRLVCPLPMPKEDYRCDFSQTEAAAFDALLTAADSVFVAPAAEPELPGRDFLYRQAGLFVASHCHVLLALWDGSAPKTGGCGTAEAVAFKQSGCGPNAGAVLHIVTPRLKHTIHPDIAVRALGTWPDPLQTAASVCPLPQPYRNGR